MNRVCPECSADFLEIEDPDPVPIEENDKIGTLHFCSTECRDEYKEREDWS